MTHIRVLGLNFLAHGSQDLYPTYLQMTKNFDSYHSTIATVIGSCGGIAYAFHPSDLTKTHAYILNRLIEWWGDCRHSIAVHQLPSHHRHWHSVCRCLYPALDPAQHVRRAFCRSVLAPIRCARSVGRHPNSVRRDEPTWLPHDVPRRHLANRKHTAAASLHTWTIIG